MTAVILLFSLESGEFTATSSNADISKTENLILIFYYFNEMYVKFEVFEKKDRSHSLSITEINNCKTSSYLSVQKAIFHATLRQPTC